jgi:hypothetical protein
MSISAQSVSFSTVSLGPTGPGYFTPPAGRAPAVPEGSGMRGLVGVAPPAHRDFSATLKALLDREQTVAGPGQKGPGAMGVDQARPSMAPSQTPSRHSATEPRT